MPVAIKINQSKGNHFDGTSVYLYGNLYKGSSREEQDYVYMYTIQL